MPPCTQAFLAAVWLLLLMLPSNSQAQNDTIPPPKKDSLQTPSPIDTPFPGHSSSTTIIYSDEIEERGYDHLDELLAAVEGVYITHDRTFTQIGMRGVSPTSDNNQRVQVLLNGLPMNNPMTGQAPSGYDLRGINMEDIERVVIKRSPGGIDQGNNATLGSINIVTKKAKQGGRLNFDTGSYGELDGGFALGQRIGKTTLGLTGRLANINGQELYIPGDNLLEKEAVDFGGLGFQLQHSKFTFRANYNQRDEQIAGLPNEPILIDTDGEPDTLGTFYYFRNRTSDPGRFKDRQLYVDFGFASPLRDNQFIDIRLFFNYQKSQTATFFRDSETDELPLTLDVPYIEYSVDEEQENLWAGIAYQHRIAFSASHQLQFGTQLSATPRSKFKQDAALVRHFDGDDLITEDFWEDVVDYFDQLRDPFENYDENFAYWSTNFFVQDFYQFAPFLAVDAGLRLDINSLTDPVLAPQLALIITPFQERTTLRLGYQRGYRLPTLEETAIVQTDNALPNDDLKAETNDSYELGIQQRIGDNTEIHLTAYHQEIQNLIAGSSMTNDPRTQNSILQNTALQNAQDSTISSTGIEGGLGFKLKNGIKTYFNYNFQFNRKEKLNMPSPLCKFGVSLPFLTHFSLYTEGQYEGSRRSATGNSTLSFFLLNANLRVQPKLAESHPLAKWLNRASFAFRVFNLFDQFYQHPVDPRQTSQGLIPQNGRAWQGQLTFLF